MFIEPSFECAEKHFARLTAQKTYLPDKTMMLTTLKDPGQQKRPPEFGRPHIWII